jgi:hypothetical protein
LTADTGYVALGCCGIGLAVLFAGFSLSGLAEAQELTDIAADLRLGTVPAAVKLTPKPALALALDSANPSPPVLAIEGIEGAAAQPVRINVFVNKRDADNRTPTTDSNCVGFIQLLPVRGEVRRTGMAFEISRTLDLDPARSIWITLVPVVGTDNSVPRDVTLRIARLYIEESH